MISKKSQHEVFGFVIIILLIIIIGTLIFSFSFHRTLSKPKYYEDIRINDLMNSIMYFSTSCGYRDVKEVIGLCYNDQKCDSKSACEYLTQLLGEILNSTLGKERDYGDVIGYQLISEDGKINITAGKQQGNLIVSKYYVPIYQENKIENLEITLYLYFGKIKD
ncbi:MAG: hypothetical protein QXM27_02155 [Candidatus Pacearchaeota archaeon]